MNFKLGLELGCGDCGGCGVGIGVGLDDALSNCSGSEVQPVGRSRVASTFFAELFLVGVGVGAVGGVRGCGGCGFGAGACTTGSVGVGAVGGVVFGNGC